MRRMRLIPLLLALLLCVSCGETAPEDTGYDLYFLTDPKVSHGSALAAQNWDGPEDADPGEMLNALLEGPSQEELANPFPRGVSLQKWGWDPERNGNLQVWLSEQYSGLSDISLTLADYCIVLTLSQLDGVESVEIISEGHTAGYRSHQILTEEEAVLLDGTVDGTENMSFP